MCTDCLYRVQLLEVFHENVEDEINGSMPEMLVCAEIDQDDEDLARQVCLSRLWLDMYAKKE